MPSITINQIASQLDADYLGDGDVVISGIASLKEAKSGHATFLAQSKYRHYLPTTNASLVILAPRFQADCQTNTILSDNPHLTFAQMAGIFQVKPTPPLGIHASAVVGDNCTIDPSASIGPHVVLGNGVKIGKHSVIGAGSVIGDHCQIGRACHLWSNVTLYYGVTLGERVEIHSGAVLGADGFGLAKSSDGWHKVPQLGSVCIGDDVEIGANTTIDRGAIEDTTIENGVKLDNQIQIAHNVRIGEHTAIAGCVGIAGSTHIGRHCMIGGAATLAGHIKITDNVIIIGMTGISKSIDEPGAYAGGIFPDKLRQWKKNAFAFKHLADMEKRLKQLEQNKSD